MRFAAVTMSLLLILVAETGAQPVLTRFYDNCCSGANTEEKKLTLATVAGVHLLRQLSLDADDDPRSEAQPLYVLHPAMTDGAHDVLMVCTMANNVYAFDENNGAKLRTAQLALTRLVRSRV